MRNKPTTHAIPVDHQERMAYKRERRADVHQDWLRQTKHRGLRIIANLSRWHPDYGMTPAEHAKHKSLREAGKVKFIPKEALKRPRSALARSVGL